MDGDDRASSDTVRRGGRGSGAHAAAAPREGRWFSVPTFSVLAGAGRLAYSLIFSCQAATITTIQKLYGLSTLKFGLMFVAYEVGEITAGVLLSYFASRSRKPRIVAAGMLLAALSSLMFAAPHFVFSTPYGGGGSGDANDDAGALASRRGEASCDLPEGSVETAAGNQPSAFTSANATDAFAASARQCSNGGGGDGDGGLSSGNAVMILYVIANVVLGVSFSPISSLAVVYIDDNASSKAAASFYQSIFYTVGYFGYTVGFGLAAGTLSIHTSLHDVAVKPSSDRWVGAWWLSFVLCTVVELILAVPLFFFPARLNRPGTASLLNLNQTGHCAAELVKLAPATTLKLEPSPVFGSEGIEQPDDNDSGLDTHKDALPSPNDLFPTLWKFVKNPLYVLTVLTSCTLIFVDAGFYIYLPMYLETQFYQSEAQANLQTGLSLSLVSTLAILIGGWVISKYKLTITQCTALTFISYLLGATLFLAATFFSCPQSIGDHGVVHDSRYNCSGADYYPACINHTTYYSSCHAGCQNVSEDAAGTLVYTGCFCSPFHNETESGGVAGVCQADCGSQLLWYLAIVLVAGATPVFSTMAVTTVLLRSVERHNRSFGLGIHDATASLLAWIPSPMIYGAVIDSTCLTWVNGSQDCAGDEEQGACYQYDNSKFRVWVHTLSFGMLAAGSVLSGSAWALALYRERRQRLSCLSRKVTASQSLGASSTELTVISPPSVTKV